MILFAGGKLVQRFTTAGLVDEYHLYINPVVLGSGKPLFKDVRNKINLKLLEARAFTSGVIRLHYQSSM